MRLWRMRFRAEIVPILRALWRGQTVVVNATIHDGKLMEADTAVFYYNSFTGLSE